MDTFYILRKIDKDAFCYLCNDDRFYKQTSSMSGTFNPYELKKFKSLDEIESYLKDKGTHGSIEIAQIINS